MATRTPIAWNDELQVVVADLDETLAGLYLPATDELVAALSELLRRGLVIVVATGQGIVSVWERLASLVSPVARRRLLAGCCTGAGVTPSTGCWASSVSSLIRPPMSPRSEDRPAVIPGR